MRRSVKDYNINIPEELIAQYPHKERGESRLLVFHLKNNTLKDDYFIERNLYPNVDFYSGIILQAIGIPLNMYTVMFAMGRMPGWIANWREHHLNPQRRIHRPRQLYSGETKRPYVPIEKRS